MKITAPISASCSHPTGHARSEAVKFGANQSKTVRLLAVPLQAVPLQEKTILNLGEFHGLHRGAERYDGTGLERLMWSWNETWSLAVSLE